jgi:ribosomal protein S18 acetylase RimI-like enzyme
VPIRPAIGADVAALIALDSWARAHRDRHAEIAAWVAAGACSVLEANGALLGYIVIAPSFFHQPMIEMLMVAESTRGAGVGRSLLYWASSQYCDEKLWCSTNQSNAVMRHMLSSEGFEFAGEIDHLDPGDPEMVYVRLPAA